MSSKSSYQGLGQNLARALRVLGLITAASLAVATSAGETNDDESNPGGNDPGGEELVTEEEPDFSEVEETTEVVVGGEDFLLTGDGAYIVALRSIWRGGGDQVTENTSRQLVAINTTTGEETRGLDLRHSGDFGVILLEEPSELVVVHRDASGTITELQGVQLPSFETLWLQPVTIPANAVRLSPTGRYLALWQERRYQLTPDYAWELAVDNLTVRVLDRQTGASQTFTVAEGLADVLVEPDSSAFYIALSDRDYDAIEQSSLSIIRVDLEPGLPTSELEIPAAGHAADLEMKGGSSLRLNAESRTLVFAGCTFEPGTCNARMYVMDADTLAVRGDFRGAGAASFDPTSDLAVGWGGASSSRGKIWITDCQDPDLSPSSASYVDHWLVTFDTETLEQTAIDLPQLAPYYFVTRDGAHAVVSMQNCGEEQLWAVDLDTGEAAEIDDGDHALHRFTVLSDNRTLYSVDRGLLERIDLDAQAAAPTGLTQPVARINRLPDSSRLVLAGPDLMTFYLYDVASGSVVSTLRMSTSGAQPLTSADTGAASVHWAPSPRRRITRRLTAAMLARPSFPGALQGQEQSL